MVNITQLVLIRILQQKYLGREVSCYTEVYNHKRFCLKCIHYFIKFLKSLIFINRFNSEWIHSMAGMNVGETHLMSDEKWGVNIVGHAYQASVQVLLNLFLIFYFLIYLHLITKKLVNNIVWAWVARPPLSLQWLCWRFLVLIFSCM